MKRDIVEMLEFGCPFKPGTLREKDAELAEAVMQLGANEIIKLRQELDRWFSLDIEQRNALAAATERAEKAEKVGDTLRRRLSQTAAQEFEACNDLADSVARAEKAESQRDRMRAALERIAQLDYTRAATNMAAYDAVKLAKAALKEVGDE